MSLCQVCRNALPNFPVPDNNQDSIAAEIPSEHGTWYRDSDWELTFENSFALHPSWDSLTSSLIHDCPVCWNLWRFLRSSPIASPDDEKIEGFEAEIISITCEFQWAYYNVNIRLSGVGLDTREIGLHVSKTTEKCYLDAEETFPIPEQHTPASVAHVASQWIRACETHHSECYKQSSPPEDARMPTRLLDLGDTSSKSWRIYQNPTHVPYAALSHRWTHETPTLLTSNHQSYCTFQPDSVLPQNYRDVVSICRAIPIRYLWIDSLCIIQDDDGSEFRQEASFMMNIYQNAVLTLTICWEFPASFGQPDSVSRQDEYVFVEHVATGELRIDVDNAPINHRAWVLQERCLSRRLLYLGNEQLYWECDGCVGSETSPGYIKEVGRRQSVRDLSGHQRVEHWSSTIRKYTACDLSFEQDRLIAIAGLAKLIASKTGDHYLAGIWLEFWTQDLLWEPARGPNAKLRPDSNQGNAVKSKSTMVKPSWSWLGFSGAVTPGYIFGGKVPRISIATPNSFESDKYRPVALLSGTVVTPTDSDHFSFFDRAILKIRCLLIPTRFAGIPHRKDQPWFFRHEHDLELRSPGLDCMQLRACEPYDNKYITFRFCFSKQPDFSLQYYLMPLDFRNRRSSLRAYGLVVQEVSQSGSREFTRIGTWSEEQRYASQFLPMIMNTIVKRGFGKDSARDDGSLTDNDRIFDCKLGEYAVDKVSSNIMFPLKVDDNMGIQCCSTQDFDEKESLGNPKDTEQKSGKIGGGNQLSYRDELVKCSSLPYFTTAEWGTISLV
ncbi:hypothetical protein FLONG3_794 [Fusarium longipes]|uniref:Heterokaryon incompatibility domain-containing protein n=1 Tax=Fusarium longipes TaxID=694270 RepID=A0A395T9U8_9HYPO|nr:hypothetical protein FLONG3_794 [Fusarium longipes]